MAAPLRTPQPRIEAIVRRRAPWILRHQITSARALEALPLANGGSFPYLGRAVRMSIRQAAVDRITPRFHHWQFELTVPRGEPAEQAALMHALERWYRERALAHVRRRVAILAPQVGVAPAGVLVRDQRTRWGSCSPTGVLRFNWRVVMAPPALIDYVIVHELVHLRVRTHGPAYWAQVGRVVPDHRERRLRLRELGPQLPL